MTNDQTYEVVILSKSVCVRVCKTYSVQLKSEYNFVTIYDYKFM